MRFLCVKVPDVNPQIQIQALSISCDNLYIAVLNTPLGGLPFLLILQQFRCHLFTKFEHTIQIREQSISIFAKVQ